MLPELSQKKLNNNTNINQSPDNSQSQSSHGAKKKSNSKTESTLQPFSSKDNKTDQNHNVNFMRSYTHMMRLGELAHAHNFGDKPSKNYSPFNYILFQETCAINKIALIDKIYSGTEIQEALYLFDKKLQKEAKLQKESKSGKEVILDKESESKSESDLSLSEKEIQDSDLATPKKVKDKKIDLNKQTRIAKQGLQKLLSLGMLNINEESFYNEFTKCKFYAVHTTKEDVVEKITDANGDILLKTRSNLRKDGVKFPADNTPKEDRQASRTEKFVFFSVGTTENVLKKTSTFGNFAFNIPIDKVEEFKNGFFTLHDLALPSAPSDIKKYIACISDEGIEKLNARFNENSDIVDAFGNGKPFDYCYAMGEDGQNLKEVLALATINTIRSLDEKDQENILNHLLEKDLSEQDREERFSNIISAFFRPQILVPDNLQVESKNYDGQKLS